MNVSAVKIEFDKDQPLQVGGGPNASNEFSLTIDGRTLHKQNETLLISEISVSRLLLGPDGQT